MTLIKKIKDKKVNFEFNKEYIKVVTDKISSNDAAFITNSFKEMHPADAADIIEQLSEKELRLAGLRINPKKNIGSRISYYSNLKISLIADFANKVKSLLTALGIIIGVFSVTLMGTLISGLDRSFESSMSWLGKDILYVSRYEWFSDMEWWEVRNRPRMKLSYEDKIREMSDYALAVSPVMQRGASLSFGDKNTQTQIFGTNCTHFVPNSSPGHSCYLEGSCNLWAVQFLIMGDLKIFRAFSVPFALIYIDSIDKSAIYSGSACAQNLFYV